MPVIGNYIAGQILTAANLNASFSQAVNIQGDAFQGVVTAPAMTATGNVYANMFIANTALTVQGQDILSAVQGAYTTANLALFTANVSNPNNNIQYIEYAWNAANGAFATANAALPKAGGEITGSLTVDGTINAANTITSNTEIHASANATVYPGQIRLINSTPSKGAIAVLERNDGTNFYLLTTGNVTAGQVTTTSWNDSIRPFSFNVWTGFVTIDARGNGASFGGNVSAVNLNATSANISQIRSETISSNANYTLLGSDSGQVIYYTNSNPIIITVPSNLFPNFRVVVTQCGSGTVTFQAASGVSIVPRTGSLKQITGQYASASLVSVPFSSNTFILDGSIQ